MSYEYNTGNGPPKSIPYSLNLYTAPATEPVSLAEAKAHLRIDSTSFADDITAVQSIAPGAHVVAASYSLKGTGADVLGYSALVLLQAGTNGAGGTVDVKIQESDTDVDADYTDWTGGAFTQVTTSNDNATYEKAYTGTKQYIRVVSTVASATCEFGVTVLKDASTSAEDTLLEALITTAREYCEGFQNRAYVTQTWDLTLDDWPDRDFIRIPLPPLQSVSSITYKDTDGNSAAWATTEYIVDTAKKPGEIHLGYGKTYPTTSLYPTSAITIRFVAGYGAASAVPKKVKQAMLLLIGQWWEHREATQESMKRGDSLPIPFGVDTLLWMERIVPW